MRQKKVTDLRHFPRALLRPLSVRFVSGLRPAKRPVLGVRFPIGKTDGRPVLKSPERRLFKNHRALMHRAAALTGLRAHHVKERNMSETTHDRYAESYWGACPECGGTDGVVTRHVDVSKREEQIGVKTTEIYAGKYKRIASDHAPLTDEGRATLQGHVDHIYSIFVNDVAAHRGVTADTVVQKMADGRLFLGRQALTAGLIDGIASLDSLIADLASGAKPGRFASLRAVTAAPSASGDLAAASAGKTVEERCKAKWEADENVRAEFTTLEAFTAFTKNHEAGHVRISGGRAHSGLKVVSPPAAPKMVETFDMGVIRRWKASAELRALYADRFPAYLAYEDAMEKKRQRGAR
jgi:hypothetical protein